MISLKPAMGLLLAMILVGCTAPVTPPAVPTATKITPTPVRATATVVPISNFEECVAAGNLVPNTYPRQCVSEQDEVFREAVSGILFAQTYGGAGEEVAYFLAATKDGGHLVAGTANNDRCLVLKLSASREAEWTSVFGPELQEEFQFPVAWFRCWLARQTTSGSYRILGTARSESLERRFILDVNEEGRLSSSEVLSEREHTFAYLDPGGERIWLRSFGLSGNVIETADGGYTLVGTFPMGRPDHYIHIIKTDAKGTYGWEKNLCLDKKLLRAWQKAMVCSNHYFWNGSQALDGGYILAGGSGNDIGLIKTDAGGNIEWMQTFSGNSARAVLPTRDGGFLIAGERRANGILIKTDKTGDLEWSKSFGGKEDDSFIALEETSNGEVFVLGGTKSFGEGAMDIWLLGIDLAIFR